MQHQIPMAGPLGTFHIYADESTGPGSGIAADQEPFHLVLQFQKIAVIGIIRF